MNYRSIIHLLLLLSLAAILAGLMGCSKSNNPSSFGGLTVSYLDVGQGDAELIAFDDGRYLLIDGGPRSAEPVLDSAFAAAGVQLLDAILLTHPHSDHVGGLTHVLRTRDVRRIYEFNQSYTTSTYLEFARVADSLQIPREVVAAGSVLDEFPAAELTVLSPPFGGIETHIDYENVNSVVLRIVYYQMAFLFTGDCYSNAESLMIRYDEPLAAQVVKVGHHGSSTSSCPVFVTMVQPLWAMIELDSTAYGHPDTSVVHLWQSVGATVLRTDRVGTINAVTDGNTLRVTADRPF